LKIHWRIGNRKLDRWPIKRTISPSTPEVILNHPASLLADIIVVIHLLTVVFIVGGVPVVYLGLVLRWAWVRRRTWRAVHLGAILFVAAEPLLGIACPLTVWEDALRGGHQRAGFIERWVHPVMFYQAPTWVFTTAYVGFAALVLVTWIAVPPGRHSPRLG
jgi:Protein of Unknown function (DUF2784)